MSGFISSRTFGALALATALVAVPTGGALAQSADTSNESNGVIHLDERFEGWFSNGMSNDPAACGPFGASADAVVWHLYLDVPEAIGNDDVTKADVKFGGNVDSEIKWSVQPGRVEMWARTSVKDPDKTAYARQGAHTQVRDAQLHFKNDDVRFTKDAAIQLGSVCYEGLGPIGEVTIYLQAQVCDGYDRFEGNQVNDASATWDHTGGDWQLWSKIFKNNAPGVSVAGKTKGCSFDGNQQFAVGTSSGMDNRYVIPATTDSGDSGLIKLSSSDLPEIHQQALFWVNQELWFERLDNHALGAFQCYDDRLHPDNFEWILIRDYDKLPSTITCVAWNVTKNAA